MMARDDIGTMVKAEMMRGHEEHASQCDGACFDDRGEWHAALVTVATELLRRAKAAESKRDALQAIITAITTAVTESDDAESAGPDEMELWNDAPR